MNSYINSCICGEKFSNNFSHFLSNWMINNKGTYCSKSGRNREVFINSLNLSKSFNPPKINGNIKDYYIYCENNKSHQGYVYFGTKNNCVYWTGSRKDFNMDYFEYYS